MAQVNLVGTGWTGFSKFVQEDSCGRVTMTPSATGGGAVTVDGDSARLQYGIFSFLLSSTGVTLSNITTNESVSMSSCGGVTINTTSAGVTIEGGSPTLTLIDNSGCSSVTATLTAADVAKLHSIS